MFLKLAIPKMLPLLCKNIKLFFMESRKVKVENYLLSIFTQPLPYNKMPHQTILYDIIETNVTVLN